MYLHLRKCVSACLNGRWQLSNRLWNEVFLLVTCCDITKAVHTLSPHASAFAKLIPTPWRPSKSILAVKSSLSGPYIDAIICDVQYGHAMHLELVHSHRSQSLLTLVHELYRQRSSWYLQQVLLVELLNGRLQPCRQSLVRCFNRFGLLASESSAIRQNVKSLLTGVRDCQENEQ